MSDYWMRDAASAFRDYAQTTRREFAGLGKKLHDALDARSSTEELRRNQIKPLPRRRSPALPSNDGREDHELPVREAPSFERTPFARELGDAWVEVEPGIYEQVALPSSDPAPRGPSP